MERIVYRKTLDVHKSGIQFTLQGFETADKFSRRIEISLMASGDTIDFPLEQTTAIMYVTTPNATKPSINKCTIKDNTIIYDALPITEEGITEMQLEVISTKIDGANGVLPTPKFAIEVSKSNTDDESVQQTTTYTALEDAIAAAKAVYDSRLLRIELDTDCMFRAIYADGTIYESDILKELFLKGDALLSQSYARGSTGIRTGEDTDNSMYYSNVSRSESEKAQRVSGEATELLTEVTKHGVYTAFSVNFESGEVEYVSPSYTFRIDKETGKLEANGKAYTFEDDIQLIVTEWLTAKGLSLETMRNDIDTNTSNIHILQNAEANTLYTNAAMSSTTTWGDIISDYRDKLQTRGGNAAWHDYSNYSLLYIEFFSSAQSLGNRAQKGLNAVVTKLNDGSYAGYAFANDDDNIPRTHFVTLSESDDSKIPKLDVYRLDANTTTTIGGYNVLRVIGII